MSRLNIEKAAGSKISASIAENGRLLISKNTILTQLQILQLQRRGITEVTIDEESNEDYDKRLGKGLLETDRSILDNNFETIYTKPIRDAIKGELIIDATSNSGIKSQKLIDGLEQECQSILNPKERDLEFFKNQLETRTKGGEILMQYLENSLAKQLGGSLSVNLSFQKKDFPNPLLELVALNQLQGDYTFLHSLNVANEVGLAAMQLNIHNRERKIPREYYVEECMIAAALADTGNLCRPIEELIYSKEKFDKNQKDIIKNHTIKGHEILRAHDKAPEFIARVAIEHHETFTGTGYPYQLKGSRIHPISALVSVADKFVALLNNKTYRIKLDEASAIQPLIESTYGDLDLFTEKFSKVGLNYQATDVEQDPFYGPLSTFIQSKGLDKFF